MEQLMGTPWMQKYDMDYDHGMYRDDVRYVKSMYEPMTLEILEHIEDECDKLEYAGSFMFDEHPDRGNVQRLVEKIHKRVGHLENMYAPVLEEDENIRMQGHCVSCRGKESWLDNLINVLLLNEILYRRRRYFSRRGRP